MSMDKERKLQVKEHEYDELLKGRKSRLRTRRIDNQLEKSYSSNRKDNQSDVKTSNTVKNSNLYSKTSSVRRKGTVSELKASNSTKNKHSDGKSYTSNTKNNQPDLKTCNSIRNIHSDAKNDTLNTKNNRPDLKTSNSIKNNLSDGKICSSEKNDRSPSRKRRAETSSAISRVTTPDVTAKTVKTKCDKACDVAVVSSDESLDRSHEALLSEDMNNDDSFSGNDSRVFASQEHILSQESLNNCDVLWDCRSPGYIKRLKQTRGQYCIDDVKEVVAHFPDDINLEQEKSPYNISGMKLVLRPLVPINGRITKTRINKKEKPRNSKFAEEVLDFLQSIKSAAKAKELELQKSEENTNKESTTEECSSTFLEDDYQWSDDELFDDSFVIEATQNPDKCFGKEINQPNPRISTLSANQSTEKPTLFFPTKLSNLPDQSKTNSNVLKSNTSKPVLSTVCKVPEKQLESSSVSVTNSFTGKTTIPKPASKVQYTSRMDTSVKQYTFSNLIKNGSSNITSNTKTTFQRHKSFQTEPQKVNQVKQSPTLTKSFRKCLSFDSYNPSQTNSSSANRNACQTVTQPTDKTNNKDNKDESTNNLSISDEMMMLLTEPDEILDSQLPSDYTNNKFPKMFSASSKINSSSNGSKIANERSVHNYNTSTSKPARQSGVSISNGKITNTSKWNGQNTSRLPGHTIETLKRTGQTASMSSRPTTNMFIKQPMTTSGLTAHGQFMSPIKPNWYINQQAGDSPVQQFFKKNVGSELQTSFLPSSSTPLKQTEADDSIEKAFNDSFMNDDALFESQILPMLEQAESCVNETECNVTGVEENIHLKNQNISRSTSQVNSCHIPQNSTSRPDTDTQKRPTVNSTKSSTLQQAPGISLTRSSTDLQNTKIVNRPVNDLKRSSPIKCSPVEIEQKRQAALQRRHFKLSQSKRS